MSESETKQPEQQEGAPVEGVPARAERPAPETSFDDAEAVPAGEPKVASPPEAPEEDTAAKYLAMAQCAQADFENYRKRVSKDIATAEAKGVAKLARELLPALDNLGIALRSGETGEEFVKGIELVYAELTAALERLGVEAYSPEGERFDPNLHEAMAKQPVDGAESGTVVEVYQRGYRLNGTVLRPARVVVAE
jgi:molecular chaperone GrpE